MISEERHECLKDFSKRLSFQTNCRSRSTRNEKILNRRREFHNLLVFLSSLSFFVVFNENFRTFSVQGKPFRISLFLSIDTMKCYAHLQTKVSLVYSKPQSRVVLPSSDLYLRNSFTRINSSAAALRSQTSRRVSRYPTAIFLVRSVSSCVRMMISAFLSQF